MTLYEVLKTVHVITAVMWVGGAILFQILAIQFRAASSGPALAVLGQKAGMLGKSYFMPLAIAQLLSGIWLVAEGDWGYESLWVVFAIVGIVASSVLGATQLGPTGEKIGELAQARGFEDPEVGRLMDKVTTLAWIDIAILVLIVADMVIKPGA